MSPFVQRCLEASQGRAAVQEVDETLGDRVIADDWTGTADYYHAVRRGISDKVARSIHDEEVDTFRERVAASW